MRQHTGGKLHVATVADEGGECARTRNRLRIVPGCTGERVARSAVLHRRQQIFLYRKASEELRRLIRAGNASAGNHVDGFAGELDATERYRSAFGYIETADQIDCGSLAGTVGPDYAGDA